MMTGPNDGVATEAAPTLTLLGSAEPQGLRHLAGRLATRLAEGRTPAEVAAAAVPESGAPPAGPYVLAAVAATRVKLTAELRAAADGVPSANLVFGERAAGDSAADERGPVWCFGGHGGQWPGMGRDLLRKASPFARAFDEVDDVIAAEGGFSVRRLLEGGDPDLFDRIDLIQPTVFAYQVALATWLTEARAEPPAVVVGHSLGELAAAAFSGALSLPDAVRVVCLRSRLLERTRGRGAMVSVGAPVHQIQPHLAASGRLSVAVYAAPAETVLAGEGADVDALVSRLEPAGVRCRRVRIDAASHSHLVDDVLGEFEAGLAGIRPRPPRVQWVSTVTAEPGSTEPATMGGDRAADAGYWVRNLRQPVRLVQAVRSLAARGHGAFVEIGPHGLLTAPIQQTLAGTGNRRVLVLGACRRGVAERLSVMRTLGALWVGGVGAELPALTAIGPVIRLQAR